MVKTRAFGFWELASVLSNVVWIAWLQRDLPAQEAWALAWLPSLVWELRLLPLMRGGCGHGPLAGRVWASLGALMMAWPVFTLLNSGFGWGAAGAAGAARAAVALWRAVAVTWLRADPVAATWSGVAGRALCGVVSALIVWTAVQKWEFPRVGERQSDYYNLLAHGFSKGTLAVDMEVKPELRDAANPWDPVQRPPGSAPTDITYYDGRFYLYFGVVPTLLLIWPFQLLTGQDLPQVYAVIFFCLGAYWLWICLWGRFVRDHFPAASLVTRLAGVGLLGLAGGLLALARRGSMWELPIAAGQFFIAAMLCAAYGAMRSERPRMWLVLAGTCLGLAVGSRPTLALAGGCLVVMVLVVAGKPVRRRVWLGRVVSAALWAGVPLAMLMAGLMGYNYLRFHDPLEFGLNYQLTAIYEAKATHFSLSYVPYNLELYFLKSPGWGRYFPFVHPVEGLPPQPAGYYGYEYVYGILVTQPLIWLALPALGWTLRPAAWRAGGPGGFVGMVAAGTLTLTAVLLAFNTAAARYMADFLPGWILLGLVGWSLVERRLDGRRWVGWLARAVVAVVAAYGMIVAYGAGAEVHGVFKHANPEGYARAARLLNTPVTWWERWQGVPAGALEMTVVFPEKGGDQYEPLLIAGTSYNKDRVEVVQAGPGKVRLMYWSTNRAPLFTEEITVQPGRAYRVMIECGALYPPAEHPYFDGWSRFEVMSRKGWVRLSVDDEVVLERLAPAHDAAPELLQFGGEASENRSFSGRIASVRRVPPAPREPLPELRGDLELRLRLPTEASVRPQPLFSIGGPGEAGLMMLRMLDADHFVLGFERWGMGYWESRPFPVPVGRVADFRFRVGSLLPAESGAPTEILRRGVTVWIDGTASAWWAFETPLAVNGPVILGANEIGSSVPQELFEGRLLAYRTLAVDVAWRPGPMRAVGLLLASSPGTVPAPVLSSGVTGRADLLAMEWLPGGRARLIYDHWGQSSSVSPDFAWQPDRAHRLEVEAPALATLDQPSSQAVGRGRLRVRLDGVSVWDTEVAFHAAASESVRFGGNDIGASTASPRWPGIVLDLTQTPLE